MTRVSSEVVKVKRAIAAEMRALGMTRAELARRLGWPRMTVTRLLDVEQSSTLDRLDAALQVLGFQLDVQVRKGKA